MLPSSVVEKTCVRGDQGQVRRGDGSTCAPEELQSGSFFPSEWFSDTLQQRQPSEAWAGFEMDGLEELMKEVEKSNHRPSLAAKKLPKTSQSESLISIEPAADTRREDETETEEIEFVTEQLREFMIDIADQEVQSQVNQSLSTIKYERFVQYYLERANLSQYSIDAELSRMNFTVTYQHIQTSNKQEIVDTFSQTQLDDLWRFANQSVYADLLVAVQHYYNNTDLLISTVASASSLWVNLDERIFEACCTFDFVVESDAVAKGRLKLGSIDGWVKINLRQRHLQLFVNSPRIPVVFDDDVR
jgi:hypothetical protein